MLQTAPIDNKTASAAIADKPAMVRAVFDELPAELKALAFTVTGIEDLKVLQAARNAIAKLPLGHDYDSVKEELLRTISPYMKNEQAAEFRAELLMRLHGGQAYAAAQFRKLDRQRDVFPYWQYLTFGDGRVRDSHKALGGKIFPANSPFWNLHYPPWEYLCRCQVRGMTRWEVERIQAQDDKLPLVRRRVMEGAILAKAENEYIIFSPKDDGTTFNVTPPSISDPAKGYRWHPGTIGVPVDKLKQGFDKDLWQQFEDKAKTIKLSKGKTLWQGMEKLGKAYKPDPAAEVIDPAKRAAVLKALGMTEGDLAKKRQDLADRLKARAEAAASLPVVLKPAATAKPAGQETGDRKQKPVKPAKPMSDRVVSLSRKHEKERLAAQAKLDAAKAAWTPGMPITEVHAALVATNDLKAKQAAQLLRLLSIPKDQRADLSFQGDASLQGFADEAAALLMKTVHKGLLTARQPSFVASTKRAHYDYRAFTVVMSQARGTKTAVHELGHWIEMTQPDVLKSLIAFRNRRAKGEAPKKLSALTGNALFGADEIAIKDDFSNPYMGKIYKSQGADFASEILSMGLEEYLFNAGNFAKNDPDYFNFIHQLITNPPTP